MALHRRIVSDYRSVEPECGDACFSPPDPPPPLHAGVTTRPPIPSPPLTPIQINNKNHALPLVVVVVASVLAVCLLFLAYYAVHRYRSSRRRRSAGLAAAWGPPQPPADAEGHLLRGDLLVVGGGGGGGEEPYHVWYIRTAGLEEAVIGAITVCEYKKGEGLVEGTDCAVCLGEFGEGEPLRLLPKCSHAFHVPCIDTWLRSHVNCPLCRAPILAPPPPLPRPPPPLPSPAVGGISSGPEVVVHGSALQATTAGEYSGGAENSLLRRIASVDGSDEGGNSAILLPAQVGVDHPPAGASSFSSEESEIWVPIDLGNGGCGDEIASYAPPGDGNAGGGELQPVRRSVSMDSSALAGLLLRMRLGGSSRDGGRKPSAGEDTSTNKKWGTGGNNRKGASLLDAQLEMERSMSGGRFLLSRFSGRACSATLPL